jgi:hypothetical protein
MGAEFTVTFDTNGNILRVVDVNNKTVGFDQFADLSKSPILGVTGVTNTQVLVANSCYVIQNGRRVKVC